MPLTIGARLGVYEITAPIGAGGMGEVYRARDTRLNREVALKILPEAFALDAERLARFRREAQVLASLNHPNIAIIHGFEDSDPSAGSGQAPPALVMEFVDGPTLADSIALRAMPLDAALPIAMQIADALESAHTQGIVHRDLKPSNIKCRADGTVKVLDFGLAKAFAPEHVAIHATQSPTITTPAMTRQGVILGTAAYMSPEQARGLAVGPAADIWAFGCVLFEMLTGRRPFAGDDSTEIIAAILRAEPEWSRLPEATPESVRRTLRRCLEKDPRRRLADIRDARLDLEEAIAAPAQAPFVTPGQPRRRERLLWATALALTMGLLLATVVFRRGSSPQPAPTSEMRVELMTPPTMDPVSLAISPDGKKVVYVASADGRSQLWVRALESGSARPLRGTDGASFPFWSPDSRSVAFFTSEKLWRVDLEGAAPKVLTFAAIGSGGTWNETGVILFGPVPDAPVFRISDQGGEATALPQTGTGFQPGQRFPRFLPDGKHFLYYVAESRGVFVGDLESPVRRRLMDADAAAVFASPSQVLVVRDGTLYAQRLNLARLELEGEPTAIAERITVSARGAAAVSASNAGSILYRNVATEQRRRLVWFDRSGRELAAVGVPDAGLPVNLSLSPDGRRLALNRETEGNSDIWVIDLDRTAPSRFTFDAAPEITPVWSPDGTEIVYSRPPRPGRFTMYQKPAGERGKESLVLPETEVGIPLDWSRTGILLFRRQTPATGWDIWATARGGDNKPFPVAETRFDERTGQLSPDGKWIAYESNESGRYEIYVQAFPSGGIKSPVSNGGGSQVRWRSDGSEIFYVAGDGRLTSVPVRGSQPGQRLALGSPVALFPTLVESAVQGGTSFSYVVSADGQRFLMSTFIEQSGIPLTLLLNRRVR